jgi:transposase
MTPDIQKEIKEALKESEGISLSNFHLATREQGKAHDKVRNNAPTWLSHQQELIEQLQEREFNHYPITIAELESRIFAQQDLLEQKDAEIEKLREIQQAIVVLTPMQRMSKAMDIIAKKKGSST